ncbi:MAG: aminopeptidase P family protein [Alphaproteobacteria bacterium]|nr:aminopeptidase P family protein [Alphaproteobacteria bacterium]
MAPDGTQARRAALEAAEAKGNALFDAIEARGLVVPGKTETELDRDIFELARDSFGVTQHWHKRIVRTGANTLCVFADLPDVRAIEADDTVYLDLGPVFGEWEADLGRTYALGPDPDKKRLVADLPRLFDALQAQYRATPDITGAALYAYARHIAKEAGWTFGGQIAGHTVGEFPHAKVPGDRKLQLIAPVNTRPMSDPDGNGNTRFWIGEIHLVDRARNFGGFYERLL